MTLWLDVTVGLSTYIKNFADQLIWSRSSLDIKLMGPEDIWGKQTQITETHEAQRLPTSRYQTLQDILGQSLSRPANVYIYLFGFIDLWGCELLMWNIKGSYLVGSQQMNQFFLFIYKSSGKFCTLNGFFYLPSTRSLLFCVSSQGRHVKTGQLAAIKVMDVTEVKLNHYFSNGSAIPKDI